jgi:hypothetical protein
MATDPRFPASSHLRLLLVEMGAGREAIVLAGMANATCIEKDAFGDARGYFDSVRLGFPS